MIIKKINNLKFISIVGRVSSFKRYVFVLIIATFLFVVGMFFGAAEYKSGMLSGYYKQLKGVMVNNLDIIPNFVMGLSASNDPLYLDIKTEDFQKLAYLRGEAFKNNGVIPTEIKDERVKGVVRYKDTKYKVKISLTGQNYDHIAHAYKWSFRIKILKGQTLNGMNKFTLLVPGTRGDNLLSEWLGHKFSKYLGLAGLRYNHKKVVVNGKDYGVYAFEEHLDKRMIENNKRREGLIVKAGFNSLKIYKKKKVVKSKSQKNQLDNLELAWQAFISGKIETHKIFDIEKLATYYALSDVLNGQHTHYIGNEFYYLNPITALLEPIGREWDAPYKKDSDFEIFIKDYTLSNSDLKTVEYQKLIFSDAKFTMRYLDELKRIANKKFINDFLSTIKNDTDLERSIIYSEYPHMNATTDFIFNKIDRINQGIDEDHSHLISVQVIKKYPEKLVIEVNNQSQYPIYIKSVLVDGKDYLATQYVSRKSTENINIKINKEYAQKDRMSIKYRFGGKLDFFSKKILRWTDNEISNKYKSKGNYEIPQINGNYVLGKLKKKWVFNRNIVIHPKSRLIIMPGVTIDLIKSASITVLGGGVELNGEKDNKINIISSDGSGQGLIVLDSRNKSYVNHTNFIGLSANNLNGSDRVQTSPVVFYESDVKITNSIFIKNTSEDALNIIRSSFALDKVLFKDNPSDAFDSDFSHGEIINSNFINIGNDAIDVSGSEVNINSVVIKSALDKAISIGERSNIMGKGVTIQESGIAISAKDSSSFIFDIVKLSHNNVAFALFNKKSEFSGASGTVNNATLLNNKVKYLVERGSEMRINDSLIKGEIKNVKKLMYGEKYGAKTVK
jgi:hypothetical protein